MTTRVMVEFPNDDDAEAFRRHVISSGELMTFDPIARPVPADIVEVEELPDDVIQVQVGVRFGNRSIQIERTEYKEPFLAADPDTQIDIITSVAHDLVWNHQRQFREEES